MLKEYLYNEWRYNVASKYLHYFEEWFKNLTEIQIAFFTAYAEGKKSIF